MILFSTVVAGVILAFVLLLCYDAERVRLMTRTQAFSALLLFCLMWFLAGVFVSGFHWRVQVFYCLVGILSALFLGGLAWAGWAE